MKWYHFLYLWITRIFGKTKYFIAVDLAKENGDYSAIVGGYVTGNGNFYITKCKTFRGNKK